MLTCKQLVERLSDYMDGRMTRWERMGLRLHILMCPPCGLYSRQMRDLVDAAGELPQAELPPDFGAIRDAVLRAIDAGAKNQG